MEVRDGINVQIVTHAHLLERSSRDLVVNKFGLKLLELFSGSNLHMMHDTTFDITSGTFTYVATHRASVIDYIAISPALMNFVTKFEVLDSILSDHCPQCLLLIINANALTKPEDLTPNFRRLKRVRKIYRALYSSSVSIIGILLPK